MNKGFTLAELLIALAVLGVIATFTIPKVLTSQTSSQNKAVVKEAASIISGAFQAYQQQNTVTGATATDNLTAYINYVRFDTSTLLDNDPFTGGTANCRAAVPCLMLHSGAAMAYPSGLPFLTTQNTSAIYFVVDPDGKVTGGAGDTGKSVVLFLYPNGRLTTWGTTYPGTYSGGGAITATPAADPSWFNWN